MPAYVYHYKKAYGGGLLFLSRPNRSHADDVVKERGTRRNGEYVYLGTLQEFARRVQDEGEYDDTWEE